MLLVLVLVAPRVFRASRVFLGCAAQCARGRRPARETSAPRASARPIDGVACGATGVPGVACCVRPGCSMRPWAAARPRDIRAASFARRVVSKPGQAPPPPTGTAAKIAGSPGALRTSGAGSLMCGWRVALMSSYGCRSATSHVIP